MSAAAIATPSPFADLDHKAPDALLGLIGLYRQDERMDKLDLGVGVYRNDAGHTPVMRSVKVAEAMLLEGQTSKSYLGGEGDPIYAQLLAGVVFGPRIAASDRMVGVQTPGGTGALRLGAELVARARPGATVWIGDPTWPNHAPIFEAAGLRPRIHRFFNPQTGTLDFAGMKSGLSEGKPGDILLVHGCCHNPTGATFTTAQWTEIADLCARRGFVPFLDLAYQGLGDGLDADAEPTRMMVEALPDTLIAYSCDKNFGLYRERVGALWMHAASSRIAQVVLSNMLSLARGLWSMPPDHGAAVVRAILETPTLLADWMAELDDMRERINALRRALAGGHPALAPIAAQRGMFAMMPLSPAQVAELREQQGIYMAGNGRINICGLTLPSIARFVTEIARYLPDVRGA